jgi:hypothetical protein
MGTKMDLFTGRIASKKSKAVFENAASDETVNRLFEAVKGVTVTAPQEVRAEAPRVNPFEAIEERNRAMDQARYEAAMVSDPTMKLVKAPGALPSGQSSEVVGLDELPAIVRQAAESAVMRKLNVVPYRKKH